MLFLRFHETYTYQFPQHIPGDVVNFIKKTNFLKRFTKYAKRHLILLITGQIFLETNTIPDHAKNILWINLSSPSLGDTLMDLSGRIFLEGRNVTLLTDKFTVQLYKSDLFFKYTTADIRSLYGKSFDHILVDSFGTKGILAKLKTAPKSLFSGMYGFFDGPEINKILFSHFRLNHLLNNIFPEEYINKHANIHIYLGHTEIKKIQKMSLPSRLITIAIGGEWGHRIYNRWGDVINNLPKNIGIALIGSSNAIIDAQNIINKHHQLTIFNFVNQISIMETAALISRSKLLLCADGGLMHIAHGVQTTTISLFARVRPQHFTTVASHTMYLYDKDHVNNIHVSNIVKKIMTALNQQDI